MCAKNKKRKKICMNMYKLIYVSIVYRGFVLFLPRGRILDHSRRIYPNLSNFLLLLYWFWHIFEKAPANDLDFKAKLRRNSPFAGLKRTPCKMPTENIKMRLCLRYYIIRTCFSVFFSHLYFGEMCGLKFAIKFWIEFFLFVHKPITFKNFTQ